MKRANEIRIIGGKHRGRLIHFPNQESLRPTPNRVRETLFNWLQFNIQDAKCLDPFAGTGILAFEAISRGAKHVTMIENDLDILQGIKKNLNTLKLQDQLTLLSGDALEHLKDIQQTFHIIFLDPPFHQDLLEPTIQLIDNNNLVSHNGFIYIETELKELDLPPTWECLKHKKAGQVYYYLCRKK